MDAFSARLTIRHVETGKETVLFQKGGMTFGEVYKWIDGRLELVGRKLFEVYLHRSEWYYCDEIELMLEVCSPVGQESYFAGDGSETDCTRTAVLSVTEDE